MLKHLASRTVTSHLVQVSLPNILSCENLRFFLGGFSFIVLQKNTNLTLPHIDITHSKQIKLYNAKPMHLYSPRRKGK